MLVHYSWRLGKRVEVTRLFSTSQRLRQLSPLMEYDRLTKLSKLRDDPHQRKIIASLNHMHSDLAKYTPPKVVLHQRKQGFFSKLFGSKESTQDFSAIPKGIYLYGDVGCGKTMLMDLFYSTIPSHLSKKRLHFHQFMQGLHKRRHQLIVKHGSPDIDTIPALAAEIAQEATVLCFDEFQVTDVADAMLLRRVIETLLAPDHGVVLFATSNRAPNELYINGIQRESFVPCIKLIEERTAVTFLDSKTDYRKVPKPISSVYWVAKPGKKYLAKASVDSARRHADSWYKFFAEGHAPEYNIKLPIWGRQLVVPKSSAKYVAQFTFHELCGEPLAAGDYLALASHYNAFVVTDIPFLSVQRRDLVRRFITFLDAVYDHHGRLCVTAAAPFEDLFVEPEYMLNDYQLKPHDKEDFHVEFDTKLVKEHGVSEKVAQKSKMFQLDEERFAFARALSRLSHMSTQDWVDQNGVK